MKLHRNSLLTAAAIVLVLYVVSLVAGLPAWAAVVLIVVLLVLLAVVWKQPDEPRPVVTKPAPTPHVVHQPKNLLPASLTFALLAIMALLVKTNSVTPAPSRPP